MSLPIPNSIEHANMDTSSESLSLSGLTLDSGVSTAAESIASGGSTPTNPPKKRVVKKMDDSEIRFLLESFSLTLSSALISLLCVGVFQKQL
eukprot:scaffold51526_cov58-Attheya_sp.AAC.1